MHNLILQQSNMNYKVKSLAYAASRLSVLVIYWFKFSSVSYSFMLSILIQLIFAIVSIYVQEEQLLKIYE